MGIPIVDVMIAALEIGIELSWGSGRGGAACRDRGSGIWW